MLKSKVLDRTLKVLKRTGKNSIDSEDELNQQKSWLTPDNNEKKSMSLYHFEQQLDKFIWCVCLGRGRKNYYWMGFQ